jgi:hypothetical protein
MKTRVRGSTGMERQRSLSVASDMSGKSVESVKVGSSRPSARQYLTKRRAVQSLGLDLWWFVLQVVLR